MAVIELNLLNSQNEFSQMGEHFQDEHNLQKFSPKWESALPFGRKSPKLSVRPYWCSYREYGIEALGGVSQRFKILSALRS